MSSETQFGSTQAGKRSDPSKCAYNKYDIIIIGGGIVGLTLAALLSQHDFAVAVVEAKELPPNENTLTARVSAIHATSQKLFGYLNAWELLKNNATPLQEMKIWDHTQNAHLHFDSKEIDKTEMGWIIENNAMIDALKSILQEKVDFYCPNFPTQYVRENNQIVLTLNTDDNISAGLIVGADGAYSTVRTQMAVKLQTRSYQQKAIIGVIESQHEHNHTAYQKFLTTGPVALLPLKNSHHTALVWSADDVISDELMKKTQDEFNNALTSALDFKLGKLALMTERQQFSLTMRHADNYVSENYALVGDAAHTIHPLAGLGVNLGLMDIACLTQILTDARLEKKSLGDLRVLRRYARSRKSENTPVIAAMRGLKEMFAMDSFFMNMIRGFGVNAVDQCSPIKQCLMKIAMGDSKDLPDFLRK